MWARKIAVSIVVIALFAACATQRTAISGHQVETDAEAININTVGIDELRRIPNIGDKLAADIIEFRERHGHFRRVEHLLLINGVSDSRFREIRHLIRVQ